MTKKPKISDVKSVFAGLRPLAASENKNEPIKKYHVTIRLQLVQVAL